MLDDLFNDVVPAIARAPPLWTHLEDRDGPIAGSNRPGGCAEPLGGPGRLAVQDHRFRLQEWQQTLGPAFPSDT